MRSSRRSNLMSLLAFTALLSGCADYLSREDAVTLRAGNAAEANAFIQVIDHWPSDAGNVDVSGN